MNVLSLFDWISCWMIALERAGIKVDKYYASEIKKDAITISQHNYQGVVRLWDITQIQWVELWKIDLLIWWSPCQSFSNAWNKEWFEWKSKLFREYIRLLKETKPKYFLLENVRMKKEREDIITNTLLEIYPDTKVYNINSSLLSAQLRNRFYWTNIPNVTIPEDKWIKLQDILESWYTDRQKSRALLESDSRPLITKDKMLWRYISTWFTTLVWDSEKTYLRVKEATKKWYVDIWVDEWVDLSYPTSKTRRGRSMKDKVHTIMKTKNEYYLFDWEDIRYLTQLELERCQTLPEWYTSCLPRNKAGWCIWDWRTVDVIAHIFKSLQNK